MHACIHKHLRTHKHTYLLLCELPQQLLVHLHAVHERGILGGGLGSCAPGGRADAGALGRQGQQLVGVEGQGCLELQAPRVQGLNDG